MLLFSSIKEAIIFFSPRKGETHENKESAKRVRRECEESAKRVRRECEESAKRVRRECEESAVLYSFLFP